MKLAESKRRLEQEIHPLSNEISRCILDFSSGVGFNSSQTESNSDTMKNELLGNRELMGNFTVGGSNLGTDRTNDVVSTKALLMMLQMKIEIIFLMLVQTKHSQQHYTRNKNNFNNAIAASNLK